MSISLKFQAVFEKHGKWYIGYIPEVPGVNAQEKSLQGARKSLLLALQELAEIDPKAVRGRKRRIEQVTVKVQE